MWYAEKLRQNARINVSILREKAAELAGSFGSEFTQSVSWINRWKERHALKFKREHGEKASADTVAADNFKKFVLPKLLDEYAEDNIYNADETGINFKGLPNRGEKKIVEKKKELNKKLLTKQC